MKLEATVNINKVKNKVWKQKMLIFHKKWVTAESWARRRKNNEHNLYFIKIYRIELIELVNNQNLNFMYNKTTDKLYMLSEI